MSGKSRIEKILENLLGENNVIEPPIGRDEKILYSILNDLEYTEPPHSIFEELLLAIKNGSSLETEYDYNYLTRDEKILFCKLNRREYFEPPHSRLERLLIKWLYLDLYLNIDGVPPFTFMSNGSPIIDYLIEGNTVQNGTPTHDSPIMPHGTGERTGNLWNEDYPNISGTIRYVPLYVGEGSFTLSTTTPYDSSVANLFLLSGNVSSGASTSGNGAWLNHDVTAQSDGGYITIAYRHYSSTTSPADCKTMLNTGSTALPYEPYGYKIPISSGGVNLINTDKLEAGYVNTLGGVSAQSSTYSEQTSGFIPVTGTDYSWTLSEDWGNRSGWVARCFYNDSKEMIGTRLGGNTTETSGSFSVPSSAAYVRMSWRSYGTIAFMLNRGSTALPYEPYNRATSNIYLGEVQTTRKIKKLVLTGREGWQRTVNRKCYYINLGKGCPADYLKSNIVTAMCSHYEGQRNTNSGSNEVNEGCICFYTSGGYELYIGEKTITTAEDFKAYLAQQYAAGTPVTVWYVLATPKTGIVNEPLMKIGDYADSINYEQTDVSIPTVNGRNTFDVLGDVEPSNVELTYAPKAPLLRMRKTILKK